MTTERKTNKVPRTKPLFWPMGKPSYRAYRIGSQDRQAHQRETAHMRRRSSQWNGPRNDAGTESGPLSMPGVSRRDQHFRKRPPRRKTKECCVVALGSMQRIEHHEIPTVPVRFSWCIILPIIDRTADPHLVRSALGRSRVVALLGPRQCGKTTLARQLVPANAID
jgi:hypothetical protein